MASAIAERCARCGTPASGDARFCASCGAPLAEAPREERRVVTVLFGDLSGYTELSEARDTEEVKTIVDRAFADTAEVIERHGGTIDKVIGDEIMAVFGAPQAHEDDAERAVRAALEIQRILGTYSEELERERGIGIGLHVGVNTGEVVAGTVGGSSSYTVLGDAVNTARRIEDAAAPGQVLVGEATYEATRESIVYRSLGSLNAKGKRTPVRVWEAKAVRGLPGERGRREAPLIGRDEELAILDAALALARRDGRATLVTLVGAAGLGKSRLATEFAVRARRAGVRSLHGRALAYGTTTPAFTLQEILRAAFGSQGEEDSSALLDEAGPALEAAAGAIERIAGAEGGLVLAFHDLHWADDALLDFVHQIGTRMRAPILVLALAREELIERRPEWGAAVGSLLLPIEPLSRTRAGEMLDLLAPAVPLPVREGVLDKAAGNPMYVQELARLLLDQPARDAGEIAIPQTVQAVIAARLDALPGRAKVVLQDAAVVGEEFWPGALRALGLDGVDDVLGTPEVVELLDLVPAPVVAGEAGYRFSQPLMHEVAYGSVPKQVRARHHAAVGDWLARVDAAPGHDRERRDLLAHHYLRAATLAREVGTPSAEADEKARVHLIEAGDRALRMDAALAAVRSFEAALPFAVDERDELALRTRLGEALVGVYRHPEATGQLERALADARRLGERTLEGRILRLTGDMRRMTGDAAGAEAPLDEALRIAREAGDEREEAAGLRARGQLDLFRGQWSSAVLWFRQALARYGALGDQQGEGWSLMNLGWASMLMGRHDDALGYLADGEKVFTAIDDVEGAGWCTGLRAWVLLLRGEVMEAGRIAAELEHHLRFEHPEYLTGAVFALELQRLLRAYVDVATGRLAAARVVAEEALATGDWGAAPWVQSLAQYPIFAVAMLERRYEAAERALEQGAAGSGSLGDPLYIGLFDFARAWLAFERGSAEEAAAILDEASGESEEGGIRRTRSSIRWLHARILWARGDASAARAMLEQDLGRNSIEMISPARSKALLAELALEAGDAEGAVACATEAIDGSGEEVLGRVEAMLILARAALAADRAEEAERTARACLDLLAPLNWTVAEVRALLLLSHVLDAQRRVDESGEALDHARALAASLPPDVRLDVEDLAREPASLLRPAW
ncbi:MAG TPA: adenylate/guanylate cyclase domain-containing protein [Actinomycetota bacterium]